jgi:Fic family protein
MREKELSRRQQNILYFIRSQKKATNSEIKKYLEKKDFKVSRITVVRDIKVLLTKNLIERHGQGRSVYYEEKTKNKVLRHFEVDDYFKLEADKRKISFENFNFKVFENLKNIFTREEIKELKELNNNYQQKIKSLPSAIVQKEFERLTIDLSWKSSQIEGNTYSLIDTEILIKQNQEAAGHKKEEAIMILNHKKALNYILDNRKYFQKLTLRKIQEIHHLLVQDLGISKGIRKGLVGIVGTKYKPLDNQFKITEALEKATKIINKEKEPLAKALIALSLLSYIQPFEDGNKRTSRMLSNALLLADDFCPLSFRSIEESEYKKAMILFYEQNSISFLKELFIEQFKFAVNNYFL